MKGVLRFVGLLFASLVFFGDEARACMCASGPPPCQSYWQASAVFVGVVTGATMKKPPKMELEEIRRRADAGEDMRTWRVFHIAVERSFRGETGTQVDVYTGMGDYDCGYGFRVGGRYLVYAYYDEKSARFSTSICTRTAPIGEADEDLEYIESLSKNASSGGTINGQVVRNRREPGEEHEGDQFVQQPFAGAEVEIKGAGKTMRVRTDGAGKFQASGLPAGEYTVKLEVPETLRAYGPERKVTITGSGCVNEWFQVEPNGILSGRVFDSSGQPAARVKLRLSDAAKGEQYFRGHSNYATTDDEGRYRFEGVPPGRFIINMRFDGEEESSRPFPNLYHPNARRAEEAAVVEIGESEKREDYDLHLPPKPQERTIEGVAVFSDGKPAAGVSLNYSAPDLPHSSYVYTVTTDGAGRFSFKGYEGMRYKIWASMRGADNKWISSQPVDVPASGEGTPVRVLIPRP